MRLYWQLHANQHRRLLASAFVYLLKHSPAVLLPVITGLTIDALAARVPLRDLWPYALGVLLLIAQNLPGHYWHVRWLSEAVREVERGLRLALAERLQLLSISFQPRCHPSTLQTKMLRDVEALEHMTRALADGVLGSGSAIVVALTVTAWRAPSFLILFLVTVPVAAGLVLGTRSAMAGRHRSYRQAVDGMAARVGEMTTMLPLTRAHALETEALERVEHSFTGVRQAGMAMDTGNAWFSGLAWVSFQTLSFTCLGVAAWAHASGTLAITLGDVVLLAGFFSSL